MTNSVALSGLAVTVITHQSTTHVPADDGDYSLQMRFSTLLFVVPTQGALCTRIIICVNSEEKIFAAFGSSEKIAG